MINIDELLPIGSIVKAKSNAGNLVYVMITGISPDSNHEYDYAIVPYPAFSGSCVAMTMIKHEDIVKVVMKGADSPVWRRFLDSLRNSNELKAKKDLKRRVRAMIHKSIMQQEYGQNDKIRGLVAYINSIEPNYKEKICNYIEGFEEKLMFESNSKEIFEKYNKNKIFKESKNLKNVFD